MKKLLCYLLLVGLLCAPTSTAHSLSVKTQGKLALAAILSGVAILTKFLVGHDLRTIEDLHAKLGQPDRVIEFERGFDCWRIEWYGHRQYIFRNLMLQKIGENEEMCRGQRHVESLPMDCQIHRNRRGFGNPRRANFNILLTITENEEMKGNKEIEGDEREKKVH